MCRLKSGREFKGAKVLTPEMVYNLCNMTRSVKITTPIPSLEEFGRSLGLSKARQKSLADIVMGRGNGSTILSHKAGRTASSPMGHGVSVHSAKWIVSKRNNPSNGKSKRATAGI
jgi:hypothetical protein